MTLRRPGWIAVRVVLAVLSLASFGLLGFLPALVASAVDVRRGRKVVMAVAAAALAGVAVLGGGLLTSVPDEDEDDVVRDDVGFALIVLSALGGVGASVLIRPRPRPDERYDEDVELPGVEDALERRELRVRFQDLARRDPALAVELGVGRPDHGRLDDGGLVDLNALDAPHLQRFAGLTPAHARSVVEVRGRLGRLASVDELVVHGTLDLAAAERLRERAVFLPTA